MFRKSPRIVHNSKKSNCWFWTLLCVFFLVLLTRSTKKTFPLNFSIEKATICEVLELKNCRDGWYQKNHPIQPSSLCSKPVKSHLKGSFPTFLKLQGQRSQMSDSLFTSTYLLWLDTAFLRWWPRSFPSLIIKLPMILWKRDARNSRGL